MDSKWNESNSDYHRRPVSTGGLVQDFGTDEDGSETGNIGRGQDNINLSANTRNQKRNDPNDNVEGEDMTTKRLASAPPSTVFLKTREESLVPKKFTSRCRLFVGHISNINAEEELKKMFEPFGEVSEIYLNTQGEFGLLKMDTRANACQAKATLDCTIINNKHISVRFAAQLSSLKVSNLGPLVSNELLRYSFGFFGEVERSIVIMDDQGKSTGQGVVAYMSKTAAKRALQKCTEGCFIITGSPQPVIVEPFHELDDEVGLQEKTIPKRTNPNYFKERNSKPRFSEAGSWEHDIAMEWKNLFELERARRDELESELQGHRRLLEEKQNMARFEEKTLKDRLKHLEEEREMLRRQLEIREKDKEREGYSEEGNQNSEQPASAWSSGYGSGPTSGGPFSNPGPSTPQGFRGGVRGRGRGGPPIKRSPMDFRRGGGIVKRGRFN